VAGGKSENCPGQCVLDVACGTGWATMAAARMAGDKGRVTGIDIADKMLDVARTKATSAGLLNVEYRVGNAESLEFKDESFDSVICASAIFVMRDISKVLCEWRRVLKAGGTVAFTSFGMGLLQPVLKPLGELLSRYDGQPLPVPVFLNRTDTPDKCRELLKNAGFKEIEVSTEQLDCRLQSPADYWQEILNSLIGPRLARLSPDKLEQFKAEHLVEVESLRTGKGIVMEVPTHFSTGRKRV
jgi:ubiquinone/menaquinone biosynthesis C-methylase UbiE